MLFLVAGNILARYHTKSIASIRGMLRGAPWSGTLWVAGFLAITGMPPFSLFFSKFLILKAAFDQGRWVIGTILLALLAVIFVALATACLGMAQGEPAVPLSPIRRGSRWLTLVPPAVLAAAVLWLGLGLPRGLGVLLSAAAAAMGGVR
jgi:hydrogenase-4 component F